MATHELKTWPRFFEDMASGVKTFEVRRDDRDFERDDTVRLVEWDPETEEYSGRYVVGRVAEVWRDVEGLEAGFAILAVEVVPCGRKLIVPVQALQTWLRHGPTCPRFGPDEPPDADGCTCGLAEEWGRRFFPLGRLSQVFHAIATGAEVDPAWLETVPPWWGWVASRIMTAFTGLLERQAAADRLEELEELQIHPDELKRLRTDDEDRRKAEKEEHERRFGIFSKASLRIMELETRAPSMTEFDRVRRVREVLAEEGLREGDLVNIPDGGQHSGGRSTGDEPVTP